MNNTKAYAAPSPKEALAPFSFQRREVQPKDVQIDILFCGVCHSDIHQARDEWGGSIYPMVPGHEIVGRVIKAGNGVTKFKVGDLVGIGCFVDSCRECEQCQAGQEQYCEKGMSPTYNGYEQDHKTPTMGGYSTQIVVDEKYVLRVSPDLPLEGVAPLLCAGITTYSPLRHWNVGKGQKVGVVGLGVLGHMGVKFAHAFGAHTVLLTTSPNKAADAKRLGADEVVNSRNSQEMQKHAGSFDFILDTASADHDLNAYLQLLKLDGTMTLVGAPEKPAPVSAFNLIMKRRRLTGSAIGGIRETQEMLDFCGQHNVTADIETVGVQQLDQAYDRLLKNDVKYRFVIDMASLK